MENEMHLKWSEKNNFCDSFMRFLMIQVFSIRIHVRSNYMN